MPKGFKRRTKDTTAKPTRLWRVGKIKHGKDALQDEPRIRRLRQLKQPVKLLSERRFVGPAFAK
jgi:hypothetical protein